MHMQPYDLPATERERLAAQILQACRVHEAYLAEYGSLGEAVRASVAVEHSPGGALPN